MSSRTHRNESEATTLSRKPLHLCIVLGLMASLALPVQAQDNDEDADSNAEATSQNDEEAVDLDDVQVVGSQIRGGVAADILSISVVRSEDIEAMGFTSGEELLDALPEQGQNYFNEEENISGGVNSARGDIGAFNLRNMGTGNTLVLMNGRRLVNSATYQTEEVGGSFVPVNSVNSNVIPVFGIDRVEVLRDGASAIYGADAVAGVVNEVLKTDFNGFNIAGRFDSYDNIGRDDQNVRLEWGTFFNDGRTNVGVFANFYRRDSVAASEDERWADSDFRRLIPEGSPWEGDTAFRNDSANSLWGQFDIVPSISGDRYGLVAMGITDSAGEFETYPLGDPRCEGGYQISATHCGHADGQGTYRYNNNETRDVVSELDRNNIFVYLNHSLDNNIELYSELSYYDYDTTQSRHAAASFTEVELELAAQSYYNPLGPCGSPNRLPDSVIGTLVPCEGLAMTLDNYRYAQVPRIIDNSGDTWRALVGMRGTFGINWDWDSAIVWSEAERSDITRNRISNTLMVEALADPTAAGYNPFDPTLEGSNLGRTLVDVRRDGGTDLKMFDFKLSNGQLFDIWGGPVGFLAGIEYREEGFYDDRDPRLDGTIVFTDFEGDTYPFVSDVVNSSPTPDNSGSRDVTSLFTEFVVPLHDTLSMQLALRYEDFSDVGSTTVPKIAAGWTPTQWLMLRGSWSEAFRAPNLITVNETLVVRNNTRDDYACIYAAENGGDPGQDILDCTSNIQRRATGSKDLKPEESTNTSVGIVLTPTNDLTMTLDFWSIEKEDTIGLFGEENHTVLDLLYRLEAGTGNCGNFVGDPAVGRSDDIEADEAQVWLNAGICPGGSLEFVNDNYQNLDTRTVEGYDVGIYYDLDTDFGDFNFSYVGTFYTKYEQEAGGDSQVLLDAVDAGILPADIPVTGFSDLIGMDGNQDEKMNARVRWRNGNWGASAAWFYLGSFYQSSLTLADGTRYVIPSMSTVNLSLDYRFDLGEVDNRIRFGVNNVADERAPLADRYFGYFSDAHNDMGRYYYVDYRLSF